MQRIDEIIAAQVVECVRQLYGRPCDPSLVQLQKTRREFEGDITLVIFPLLKLSGKPPEKTAFEMGEMLTALLPLVTRFSVVKGFLNLTVSDEYYISFLNHLQNEKYAPDSQRKKNGTIMVEYSSPNTNKPLHLGHVRNNLLGFSISSILKAAGYQVIRTNLVNDRGIHICKSMLAWQLWGNGETPEKSGKKGDHLVGEYYVKFDRAYKEEVRQLINKGMDQGEAEKQSHLMKLAQEMLRKWESDDTETIQLWKTMNSWVYEGFEETYRRLGVTFDRVYYESETWLPGKQTVLEGLEKGILKRHDDGSVWADLTARGLDEKVLLRSDGTSVYMTQDIGTAQVRQQEYSPDRMVYVVGNEQNYHFKVLAHVLDMLGFPWAGSLHHLSYGMVELPEGKMKSREGTIVDADDLMDGMTNTAREMSRELGKLDGFTEQEKEETFRIIGLGALKYFMLKVDPVKNMLFNPRESIDFEGNTGPFIQYTFARIRSVFRKAAETGVEAKGMVSSDQLLTAKEKNVLKILHDAPAVLHEAADSFNPALIANYVYDLAREYNQFYHDHPILKEENTHRKLFRLALSEQVSRIISQYLLLLGIEVPERM